MSIHTVVAHKLIATVIYKYIYIYVKNWPEVGQNYKTITEWMLIDFPQE